MILKLKFLFIAHLIIVMSYGQTSTIKLLIDLGTRYDYAYSIAIQEDNKVLVAGDAYGYPFIVRFDTTGSFDPTFGNFGREIVSWDCGSNPSDNDIKIQADGKIVLGASYNNGTDMDFILSRYNIDGTLDESFGSSGQAITKIGNFNDQCNCIVIQPDGKIVAGGTMNNAAPSEYNCDFALVRFNSDGTLDPTFGEEGKVTTKIGVVNSFVHSMAIQQDGKIIMAGEVFDTLYSVSSDLAVVRYNPDGTLDHSFGTDGIVRNRIHTLNNNVNSVVLQQDDKILIAGSTWNGYHNIDFALLRYNSDGSLDSTFGQDGIVVTDISDHDEGKSVALQPDNKIILAGGTHTGLFSSFATLRYNVDGSLDETFGTDGLITTSFGYGDSEGLAMDVRSNGEIIVVGYFNHGAPYYMDVALLRLFSYLDSLAASPTLLTPANGAKNQPVDLTISWNQLSEAISYHLLVSKTIDFKNPLIDENELISNSYSATGLSDNTTYYWKVGADIGDIVTWSDTWSFTTNATTEVSEEQKVRLNIYPVPTSETINITGIEDQISTVSILSVEGQIIKQLHGPGIREINVKEIAPGIYIIQVYNPIISTLKKIIIE